ncbi:hypothetical protein ACJW30_04G144600 [Castanea mollissima]
MASLIYIIPFLLFTHFVTKWLFTTSTTQKNLPPSPPKLPIFGNLHQLGLYPNCSLATLAQRHGPLMLLHFGKVIKTHDAIFSTRPKLSINDKLLYKGKDLSTAPYGEYRKQMRSICVLQLLSNKRVQSFRAVREEVNLFIEKVKESYSLSLRVSLSELFANLTNDVICRVAFGKKYGGDEGGRKFNELLGELMRLLGVFHVGDFIPSLVWVYHINGFDAQVDKEHIMYRVRRESNGDGSNRGEYKKDLVDVLLEIQKDNSASLAIDREHIKAHVDVETLPNSIINVPIFENSSKKIEKSPRHQDMFAAGTDTTYTVLEWATSEFLRHPRVMKKLQSEVRGIAKDKPYITENDLEEMHYLKAVIKETLRLYPPIQLLVPRESTQDIKIKGHDIAAGTMVITNAWAIAKHPSLWDNPTESQPERFLNSTIDFKGHDFQLIPFGAGRRGCPGITFAMATNDLLFANLVHKFDWALPDGAKGEDLDMTECSGLTIHRKVPLLAVATPSSC